MTTFDVQYHALCKRVMSEGTEFVSRAINPKTGKQLKAKKVFAHRFEFNLQEEFPILTTKKMPKSKEKPELGFLFSTELQWIYVDGSNVVADLQAYGNHVWDEWMKEDGTIGPAYGHQTRQLTRYEILDDIHYNIIAIDQVQQLIDGLKNDPFGRRHIINLWNVEDLPDMALMPCAFLTIWDVEVDSMGEKYLNLHLIQRS